MAERKPSKDLFDKWVEAGEVESKLAIVQSLSMQGRSAAQIGEAFGVTRRTIMNLQKKHPAMKKAIETGRLSVVAMCQNKLMERVSSGDTIAIIYALKVYGGDFFNDRRAVDAKISGAPISVQPNVQVYLPSIDTKASDKHETENK